MALRTTTRLPGLVWHGSFLVHHSLALVNRELTLALMERGGADMGLQEYEPATFGAESDPRIAKIVSRLKARPAAPAVTVRHLWPPDFTRPQSDRFVLIQPWEFGSLPTAWVDGIARNVDECWVPSHYVKQVYTESGVPEGKVFVVPNGVNTARFHPGIEPLSLPTTKGFKFLFVGGTIGRKGIDILLEAYVKTFTDRDDVTLIIKDFGQGSFYSGQGAQSLIAAARAKPGAPEIVYLSDEMSEVQIAGLYAACDVLVHPYRGEGYGLPIAEAMACGKPTIITGAGAALDFADDSTSYLIPARRVVLNQRRIGDLETVDLPWWYEPDREALCDALRRTYQDSEEARGRGTAAAARIANHHTWDHAAEAAWGRLEVLFRQAASEKSAPRPAVIEPVTFENRKQKVLSLTRDGHWLDAIPEAEACLRVQPADDDLSNALAVSLFRADRRLEAIALLRKCIERSPKSRDFQHNLAFMLLQDGSASEALDHALIAARLSPESSEVRRTLERSRNAAQKQARRVRKQIGKDDSTYQSLTARISEAVDILSTDVQTPTTQPEIRSARLSVVMIVRNEEEFLEDCLRSVQGAADEIVVVDTGSTDRTVEIALRFGAKVVPHVWADDFSAARNVSLEHATGDWALWLDADERLAKGETDLLRYLIHAAEPQVGGYMVNIRNFMSRAEHAEVCWHRACRLFRLDPRIRFNGRIHEQNMRGLQEAGYVCALSQLNLDHLGYASDVMNQRGKHDRFIRMLTREVEENPDDSYRTFHLFNLGNAYFTRGDMNSAATWLSKAADGADPTEEYTSLLFVEWATALYATNRPDEALAACRRAEEIGVDHPGIDFARGHAYLHLQNYHASEQSFRECLARGAKGAFVLTGDAGAYTYKARYGLGLALTGQERYEEAAVECRLAIQESPRFVDAWYLLANSLRRLRQFEGAHAAFEELLSISSSHSLAVADYACTLHEMGDLPAALTALRRASVLQPSHLEVWTRLASTAESLGLFEEFRNACMNARRLAPRSAEVLVNLGRAYGALGDNERALDCFTDAIYLDPQYANAYFNAGDLLFRLGYYPKAAEAYCAGLDVNPQHAPGFLVLGNCLARIGELDAAREAFSHAVSVRSDYPEALQNLQVIDEMILSRAA